jgi:hypothetical protein
MKSFSENVNTCHHLAAQLPWNHLSAFRSAKILASKAYFLVLDREVVEEILFSTPSANFIRENPEVFLMAWREVSRINQAEVDTNEPDDFLDSPDEQFDQYLRLRVVVSSQQANRKTASARRN